MSVAARDHHADVGVLRYFNQHRFEHLIRTPLTTLDPSLDPDQFWRVHRGIIVSEIARAERDLRGRYTLTLRSHPETIRTSRPYAGLFRSM